MLPVERKMQCSKGDRCSFRHESYDRAPRPTPKAEPSMTRGRSASRKGSARGRSQSGKILRQPCRYYLKGTCTRSPCEYWHPPECQFFKTESGCKAGAGVCSCKTRLKNNQEKAEKELLTRKRRRQECCSYCENSTSIGVMSRKTPSHQNFRKRMKYRGRVRFTVCATSSQYPRKSRTVAWKNTSQTSSSAKSLRYGV